MNVADGGIQQPSRLSRAKKLQTRDPFTHRNHTTSSCQFRFTTAFTATDYLDPQSIKPPLLLLLGLRPTPTNLIARITHTFFRKELEYRNTRWENREWQYHPVRIWARRMEMAFAIRKWISCA